MKATLKRFLFAVILCIPSVVLAATELNQASFDDAINCSDAGASSAVICYSENDVHYRDYFLKSGEYKLTSDVELVYDAITITDKTIVLDLNGKTLHNNDSRGTINGTNANLTIKGNGTIHGEEDRVFKFRDSDVTIENGNIQGIVDIQGTEERLSNFKVKDGTFLVIRGVLTNVIIEHINFYKEGDIVYGGISLQGHPDAKSTLTIDDGELGVINVIATDVIINDGSYISSAEAAVQIGPLSSVVINGGTFEGDMAGLLINGEVDNDVYPIDRVEINGGKFSGMAGGLYYYTYAPTLITGGTFNGKMAGAWFNIMDLEDEEDVDIVLKGGTFKSNESSDQAIGGIVIMADREISYESFVPEGYEYSPEFELISMDEPIPEGYYDYISQKEISVQHIKYVVLEGDKQIYSGKDVVFKYNIPFFEFEEDGKVYIDGKLLDAKNYKAEKGSTILTLLNDYVKGLNGGNHTVKVTTSYGEVEATFSIPKGESEPIPPTVDNIIIYVSALVVSAAAFIGIKLFTKKRKNN